MRGLGLGMIVANADGFGITELGTSIAQRRVGGPQCAGRRRVTIRPTLENPLVSGPLFRPLRGGREHTGSDIVPLRAQRPRVRRLRRRERRAGGHDRARDRGPTGAVSRDELGAGRTELRTVHRALLDGRRWRRLLRFALADVGDRIPRTYFGTVLGYLWSLIRPLALFGILLFVFTQVFKLGSDVQLPGAAALRHRPVRLLPRATDQCGHFCRRPGGSGSQDPVPAARDPALGRAHRRSSTSPSTWSSSSSSCWPGGFRRSGPGCSTRSPGACDLLTTTTAMMLSVLYVRFRDVSIIWTVWPACSSTRRRSSTR